MPFLACDCGIKSKHFGFKDAIATSFTIRFYAILHEAALDKTLSPPQYSRIWLSSQTHTQASKERSHSGGEFLQRETNQEKPTNSALLASGKMYLT